MAEPSSGSGTYGAFVIVVLIAVAALALFRFNLFGVHELIYGGPEALPPIAKSDPDNGQVVPTRESPVFDETPPDDTAYRVNHATPLPERINVPVQAGEKTINIPMRLVPQGWFIMGANDGIHANGPLRWIWLDDYYIAETECTNEQYYAFILANGYEAPQYWREAGYNFIRDHGLRGTSNLGWISADGGRGRIWWLASPASGLTLELRNADRSQAGEGLTVLALPHDEDHSSWLNIEPDGRVRLNQAGRWVYATAAEVALQSESRGAGLIHRTDTLGQIRLPQSKRTFQYTIVAWPDGDDAAGLRGEFRRDTPHWMLGAEVPVMGVNWFEADACCAFFGGSLPTEAQWEKAARGTDGRRYPWGNDAEWELDEAFEGANRRTTPHANINRWRLTEVGSFPSGASKYGIVDMLGNVSEWCADVYSISPPPAQANPVQRGPVTASRSERGAKTNDDEIMPVYHRRSSDAFSRGDDNPRGFRLAMTPEQALGR